MFEERVAQLLDEALAQRNHLFLIDMTISPDRRITVTLDGDQGVTVQDCIDVSRHIEHNLDREEVDFALEVASAGATAPLQHPRQYKKNVGRKLEVKTAEGKTQGTLESADEEKILLTWKAREPKPVGKGKITVEKRLEVPYSDIEEAKVKIVF